MKVQIGPFNALIRDARSHEKPRTSGYRLLTFGQHAVLTYDTEDYDRLVFTMLADLMPLSDGLQRLGRLRDAIDAMIQAEGVTRLQVSK